MKSFNSRKLAGIAIAALALAGLTSQAAEPNTLTADEKAAGWRLLFDGKSTDAWRGFKQEGFPEKGWRVDDGTLHKIADERGGDIISRDTFENFEFSWEWKLLPGGNNGVKYFIFEERGAAVGHEYQMIDDKEVHDELSSCGSFYLVVAPRKDKPVKPFGEWNQSRLVVQGNHVEHWLNGMKVVEYECGSPEVMNQVPKTKFKKYPGFGEKVKDGHILLTDHKDPCWFRNLKIRELKAE